MDIKLFLMLYEHSPYKPAGPAPVIIAYSTNTTPEFARKVFEIAYYILHLLTEI
jgi:hypothetical protein